MAKLELALVLKTIDKATAPLKAVQGTFSQTNKKITAAQKALKNTSHLRQQISQFRQLAKNTGLTGNKYKAASTKLEQLQAKLKQTKSPSTALQSQLNKQQKIVTSLNSEHTEYIRRLQKLQTHLKKSKIDTSKLSAAEKTLNSQQRQQINQISKLQTKYAALARVKNKLSKIKIGALAGGVKNLALGGGAVGAGLFAFFRVVNSNAASLDKLSKASKNLDFPIDKLQALQHHATLSGVGTDTTTTSLIRFNKRLGVLKTTGSGALGSFLKLGKNTALFNQFKKVKDTAAAYDLLLKSFGKIKDEHKRMALLDAAFGGSGRSMMVMMREGQAGLNKAREEFSALGGGANQQDVQAAEDYNDAWHKLMTGINAVKIKVLTPVIQNLTQVFSEFTDKFKNAKWRDAAILKVQNAIYKTADALKFLYGMLKTVVNYFPEIVLAFALVKIAVFALNAVIAGSPLGILLAAVMALGAGLAYLYAKFEPVREVMHRLGAGIKAIGAHILNALITPLRLLMKLLAAIPQSLLPDSWNQSISAMNNGLDDFSKQLSQTTANEFKYALSGKLDHSMINTAAKSQSEVKIKIESDKPMRVDQIKADRNTDLQLDTGNMVGFSY